MSTKDTVAQNILAHESLYKKTILLDQFKEGLKKIGALQLIQLFPDEMSSLFIYQGALTANDVSSALYITNEEGSSSVEYLHHYIHTLKEKGCC